MTEYEAVIHEAEDEAGRGRYKEAYNRLARALWLGGPEDQECRYRRGLYAYKVARSRLDDFEKAPVPKHMLIKAGCWLARSEAYLSSSAEGVDPKRRDEILEDLARTSEEQERFRRLCRGLSEDLFVAKDEVVVGE